MIAHHLYSHAKYPEYRKDTDNGVCLSYDTHLEFHKRYGSNLGNTYDQFAEFYKNKTGKPFNQKDVKTQFNQSTQ